MPSDGGGGYNPLDYAKPAESYLTSLPPEQEAQFQAWVKSNKIPFDSSPRADYDMRGFWRGLQTGDPRATSGVNPNDSQVHFSDYWKTPYHKSFSSESQWALPGAPSWNDQSQLVMPDGKVVYDERQDQRSGPLPPDPRPAGERRLPPWLPINSRGETYSPGLALQTPQERAAVDASMRAIGDAQRAGRNPYGIAGQPSPESTSTPAQQGPPNQLTTGGQARPVQPSNPLASQAGQYTPTEAGNLVGHYESEGLARKMGIDPYMIGVGGTDLSKAQSNQYGFPIWEGHGNSHAAGRYQFQPGTWEQYAKPLGITDFSPASQDAVFRAAYLDRGFGHWAPYNSALASHIGQPAPQPLARIENPLGLPSGGQPQAPVPDQSWLDRLPPAEAPASSPWLRLMQLSAIAQSAHIQPVLTKYDPRKGMVAQPEPMQPTRIMQTGTGELPGSAQVPRTTLADSALPVGSAAASHQPMSRSPNTMLQPTQYVTRLGMRPYYES